MTMKGSHVKTATSFLPVDSGGGLNRIEYCAPAPGHEHQNPLDTAAIPGYSMPRATSAQAIGAVVRDSSYKDRLRLMSLPQWFRRSRLERELTEEMEAHREERAAELMRAGLSAADAHDQARREFGNTTLLRERSRDVWSLASLDDFLRTVAHAARALRRGGAYTAVSIITLALGIGANGAIFSLIDAVLLRPLPYEAPEQLVRAGLKLPGISRPSALTPEFVAFRNENHTFVGLIAWNDEEHSLTGAGEPERVSGAVVSGDFLSVLGVRPSLGRGFRMEEDRPGAPRVAIISDELWRRHWNASPSVIGRGMVA